MSSSHNCFNAQLRYCFYQYSYESGFMQYGIFQHLMPLCYYCILSFVSAFRLQNTEIMPVSRHLFYLLYHISIYFASKIFSYSFIIKFRNKAFICIITILYKSIYNSELSRIIHDTAVLSVQNLAFKLLIFI